MGYWSSTTYQAGIYGTQGIPSPDNNPSARHESTSMIDSSNNLYLFGGWGTCKYTTHDKLNDLWVYTSICSGIPSINPHVCSGRGKCVDDDVCQCIRINW